MRFYHLTGPGPIAQTLRLATATCPSPESLERDQVLIEVVVAGINPADYKIPELGYVAKAIMPFPKTPGMDFGGRVVAIGPDILHIKTGDRVIGRMNPLNSAGSLSEYVVAAYDDIAVLPETVPLDQAGVAATAALTAYQSIVPFVKKGDKVFINGGSGGTGTFGIQIAKALGCHVTVSCSTAKVSLCRDLGGSNHKFEVFATKNSHEDMAQISTWMGEGKLKTVIDSTLAFEDLLKAYQKLKQGSARGKILVRVREGKRVIETVRDELN